MEHFPLLCNRGEQCKASSSALGIAQNEGVGHRSCSHHAGSLCSWWQSSAPSLHVEMVLNIHQLSVVMDGSACVSLSLCVVSACFVWMLMFCWVCCHMLTKQLLPSAVHTLNINSINNEHWATVTSSYHNPANTVASEWSNIGMIYFAQLF